MSYLTEEAVLWAVTELSSTTSPFLGITFLACKERGLPVGHSFPVQLHTWTQNHLCRHHRLDPSSEFFFQPFRSPKRWVASNYASTGLQAVNTQRYRSVFLHVRGRSEWGFTHDYVNQIKSKFQTGGYRNVPLAAIAIWTAKDQQWQEDTTTNDLIAEFLQKYKITPKEKRELFSTHGAVDPVPTLVQTKQPDWKAVAHLVKPPPDAVEPEGTLTAIRTKRVGPADEFRIDLGDRLTVVGGDNGLGKSFLLEVAWWAATGGWANRTAMPFAVQDAGEALIEYELRTATGVRKCRSLFNPLTQSWISQSEYPHVPALYVYANVDGGFSVSDDYRERVGEAPTINFTAQHVWDGKRDQTEGLIRDWVRWQISGGTGFSLLKEVLRCLSPSDLGLLAPGEPRRLAGEPRPIPVISHPYGEVPIPYAAAGVRRILMIAYTVVWSWRQHLWAAKRLGLEPVRRVVLVVDEIEAHLHPFWQRTILPAILRVGQLLDDDIETQTIVSTHSPLVMASLETEFRPSSDMLLHLKLQDGTVVVESQEFAMYGDVSSWLTSPMVGLRYPRSKEAEQAIERAVEIQLSREPATQEVEDVSEELLRVLPPDDLFWYRWTYFAEQAGVKL